MKLYAEDKKLYEQFREAVEKRYTLTGHRKNIKDAACEYVFSGAIGARQRQGDIASQYNCSEVSLRNTAKRLMMVAGMTRKEIKEWIAKDIEVDIASRRLIELANE